MFLCLQGEAAQHAYNPWGKSGPARDDSGKLLQPRRQLAGKEVVDEDLARDPLIQKVWPWQPPLQSCIACVHERVDLLMSMCHLIKVGTFSSINVVNTNTQYYGGLAHQMGKHGTAPFTDGRGNGNADTGVGEC